jgi:sigma-E factor negative regulatory protein RseB
MVASKAPTSLSRLPFFVLLCVTSWPCFAGSTNEQARAWLDKMLRAGESLNYDGTFVYRNGEEVEAMRIIHQAGAEGGRQRLVALGGVAREVIRDRSRVTCILPDHRSVVVTKSRYATIPSPSTLGSELPDDRFYQMEVIGTDRVAGRTAEIVGVRPRDAYRYGYRLWVDHETGLLLKSALLRSEGKPLEQFAYTSLMLPEQIPDTLLSPGISAAGFTWYESSEDLPARDSRARRQWRPTWLPMGFMLRDSAEYPLPTRRMPVDHLFYSDGLASLSIYIEKLESTSDRLDGVSSMGALNAFGKVIEEHQVTVVGEVPVVTVRSVGKSVRRALP